MTLRIPLDAPNIGPEERAAVDRCLAGDLQGAAADRIPAFEAGFARRIGRPAAATRSGTAALHLVLRELGIGPGDEVVVPALTFVATVNPVAYVGAAPVFCDVDPETWTLDPERFAALVTPRTRAVIPVHLFGAPCAMDRIVAIAEERGIRVIEDATESLGATFRGRPAGALGDFAVHSFNLNKVITGGGGGMATGADPAGIDRVRFLSRQARSAERGFWHAEVGYNERMTPLEATLGLAQFARLDEFVARKRALRAAYAAGLAGMRDVRLQAETPGAEGAAWMNALLVDREGVDLDRVVAGLHARGIGSRRSFEPVADFPPYADCPRGPLEVTRRIAPRLLWLPSSTRNGPDEVAEVCATLAGLLG